MLVSYYKYDKENKQYLLHNRAVVYTCLCDIALQETDVDLNYLKNDINVKPLIELYYITI